MKELDSDAFDSVRSMLRKRMADRLKPKEADPKAAVVEISVKGPQGAEDEHDEGPGSEAEMPEDEAEVPDEDEEMPEAKSEEPAKDEDPLVAKVRERMTFASAKGKRK